MDYPPDWMLEGDLPDAATVKPELYGVLARYYAAYVEAYARHNVTIDFLEAFNEPQDSYTNMGAAQLAELPPRPAGLGPPNHRATARTPTAEAAQRGQAEGRAERAAAPKPQEARAMAEAATGADC